jgi:hypothetical protein
VKKREIKKLRQLDKKMLIEKAFEQIQHSGYDKYGVVPENFANISVSASKEDIRIVFDNIFKYLPQNSEYLFSITVTIPLGSISYNTHANPKNYRNSRDNPGNFPLIFKDSPESTAVIQKVQSILNIPPIDPLNCSKYPYNSIIIRDNELYYDLVMDSSSTMEKCKISKESGEIFDQSHKHMARSNAEIREEIVD